MRAREASDVFLDPERVWGQGLICTCRQPPPLVFDEDQTNDGHDLTQRSAVLQLRGLELHAALKAEGSSLTKQSADVSVT